MEQKELLEKVCNELRNYISLLEWAGNYADKESARRGLLHTQTIREYIHELNKLSKHL